jgi:hypothetical protein
MRLPGLCAYCSEPAHYLVDHYRRNGPIRTWLGLPTRHWTRWVCGIHILDPFQYALRGRARKRWLDEWK